MKSEASESELHKLLQIAWPLVLSSLISMAISITDVFMTGWLGQLQLAAGAAASDFYSTVYYVGLGVIAALSPIIGQALGAKDRRTIRRSTQQAFWVVAVLCVPGVFIIWHSDFFLSLLQVKHEIIVTALPYSHMMAISFCFMLLAMVWHYFLSAHKRTQIIFRTMLVILPLNAVGNYILMYGKFGLPEMGLAGVGLSSVICAATMFIIYSVYVLRHREYRRYRFPVGFFRLDPECFFAIFRIGLPIGMINLAELGIFLLSTVIMGAISVETLAAHTVAIRMAGVIYALPLGLAQAAAIRIAFSVGEKNAKELFASAGTAYKFAVLIGVSYMCLLWAFSGEIAFFFLNPEKGIDATLAQASLFLIILAIAQPLSCVGTISGGILRGLKDTRIPMIITLICYWGIGFVVAMVLAFVFEYGGTGIWIGLALAEAIVGVIFTLRLIRFKRKITADFEGKLVEAVV